jgi:hypothetical protein
VAGFLIPGLVLIVLLLKARPRVLALVAGVYLAANLVALAWVLSADDGAGSPAWLVVLAIALWFFMVGSLMVEAEAGSWWERHRLDERFSTFFRWVGVAFLVACPAALAVAYIFEGTILAVLVMGLFAVVVAKAFAWDALRA